MIEVVGALIKKEGKFLICKRNKAKSQGNLWEFPGGKIESGETKEDAIIREIKEELDMDIKVIKYLFSSENQDLGIILHLMECQAGQRDPKLKEHEDLKWITIQEAKDYKFCKADIDLLQKLRGI